MKKLSLLLALVMVISVANIPVMGRAEYIQPILGAHVKTIIEKDGYQFKDMNSNGKLDVYEDWRMPVETRVNNLISQMTLEEEVGLLFCINTPDPTATDFNAMAESLGAALQDWKYYIDEFNLSCYLDNVNGTPADAANAHNEMQEYCENTRLGIPMVFTCDREYNAFGGYIDKPHDAFGVANDPKLAEALLVRYAQAMKTIGIHVTFEPYGNEIGSFNGEDPQYIAKMAALEVGTLERNGLSSCTKHWIGRGGDSSFGNARSVAQNFDNWLEGWKAAVDAGCEWVMTNSGGTGITNTVSVDYDRVTMKYLREELGFKGVVVTDWWALGMGSQVTGITPDGEDLGTMNGRQLYRKMLECTVDVFGAGNMVRGEDISKQTSWNYPDCIINGVKEGDIEKELVDAAARRVLTYRFNKGLFENPYVDVNAALAYSCSKEYIASPWPVTNNEELKAARNPLDVELDEKMQASSAVLVKNDNNLLPLDASKKVYVQSSSADLQAGYIKYISKYATVVENIADADVVIGDFGTINDVTEQFIDDAKAAGKPIVLTLNCIDPTVYTIENADALIYMSFKQSADHGSQLGGFITTTEPWVYADLLYGVRQPTGMIVKELARDKFIDAQQWKDLAGDQGASPWVRLMIQATMENDANHSSPNNWGDPLLCYKYGMRYGANPEFKYSCLSLPTTQVEVETESNGSKSTSIKSMQTAKAGETFAVYALLRNNGSDGMTKVQVYDNDTLIAEKVMAVNGGSWRVVQMDITLSDAGEHTIKLGDQVGKIIIE